MEYNKLEIGKSYTLSDLLAKDNKIVIPDLQRDYCWGTTQNKEGYYLAEAFVKSLINKMSSETMNLGILYGYEVPKGHIQLCDGQQRITTLFLLLGMLNRKANNAFRGRLMSELEINDGREPYLQYAIRESSLYFLSDLVWYFFINDNGLRVDDIKKQSWYFKEYDYDPSVVNMLAAMSQIEKLIQDEAVECKTFGEFVSTGLSFIYYDMGSRANGEETFVIINTTGEPLSATENLKPLLITKQPEEQQAECSNKWENWETYFWHNRKGGGNKKNDTSDNGLNEFFGWVMLLEADLKSERFKSIQAGKSVKFDTDIAFDKIDSFFDIVKFLFDKEKGVFKNNQDWLSPDESSNYRNSQIALFRLLPVMEYVKRFGKENERNILRVKMFFRNLAKNDRISKNIEGLVAESVRIIRELPDADIASLLSVENVSKLILSEENILKLTLYRNKIGNERNELEERFWHSEEHPIWKGEILPLLKWSISNESIDVNLFDQYNRVFTGLFHDTLEYPELDITRRALLTRGLKEYPKIFNGYTNTSFCWEYSDWQTLINENVAVMGAFFKELIKEDDIYVKQQEMIEKYPDEKDYAEFVKIPELLKYCEQKNIQWRGNSLGWILIQRKKATKFANLKSYRLYLELKQRFVSNTDWKIDFWSSDSSCAFMEKAGGTAIDVWHTGDNKYALNLFNRVANKSFSMYSEVANKSGLLWNGFRYELKNEEKDRIIELVDQLLHLL